MRLSGTQDDVQLQKAVEEAQESMEKSDLDAASVAIAKAEQLAYEKQKRRRWMEHDTPRLLRSLEAEAEACRKSGNLAAAQKATERAEQLRAWTNDT